MLDNAVSRFQGGVTNVRDTDISSDMPTLDQTRLHNFFADFDYYTAADYVVTKVGTGTNALVAGDGGVLQMINSAAGSDAVNSQKTPTGFKLVSGLRCWGKFIFSIDNSLANIVVGLHNTTTAPFTPSNITDGIYVSNSGTALSVFANVAAANVSAASVAVLNPGLTNYVTFSFYWDGKIYGITNGRVVYEFSGAGVVAPVRGELLVAATFPAATLLSPSFAVQNSSAAARTLNMDLISVVNERVNITATPAF